MKEFTFHPELFEHRESAIEALSAHGIDLFTDYSTVDLEHELYGLEVGSFQDRAVAEKVLSILRPTFPFWRVGGIFDMTNSPGWWVLICKNVPQPRGVDF